jgi:hypothetical protein
MEHNIKYDFPFSFRVCPTNSTIVGDVVCLSGVFFWIHQSSNDNIISGGYHFALQEICNPAYYRMLFATDRKHLWLVSCG